MHALGSPVFPRRLFSRDRAGVREGLRAADGVEGRTDGLAGVLTLLYEDQALPYYGGALRGVPQLTRSTTSCTGSSSATRPHAGYRVFDFGRSREGTGAYHFKRHWGFEPVPLPYQYILMEGSRMPNLSPSNPKMHLAVQAWKRMPLAVTKVVGPRLTRYLP